jgi:hypothetical protein
MEPVKKNKDIRDLQSDIMGVDVPARILEDRCVSCGGDASEFKSDLARREFSISGLCQSCQDVVFRDPEDDD